MHTKQQTVVNTSLPSKQRYLVMHDNVVEGDINACSAKEAVALWLEDVLDGKADDGLWTAELDTDEGTEG